MEPVPNVYRGQWRSVAAIRSREAISGGEFRRQLNNWSLPGMERPFPCRPTRSFGNIWSEIIFPWKVTCCNLGKLCSCRKSVPKIFFRKYVDVRPRDVMCSKTCFKFTSACRFANSWYNATGEFVEPWFKPMKMWIINLKIHAPGAGTPPLETRSALKASETFQRQPAGDVCRRGLPHRTSRSRSQHKPKRYINTAFCKPSQTAEKPPLISLTTFISGTRIAQSAQWLDNRALYFLNYLWCVGFEVLMAVFAKSTVL